MSRFLIVDGNNLCQRCIHVVKDTPDHREWMGRAYAIIFQSMIKMFNMFLSDHIVCCFDSYSWREEIYNNYKEKRKIDLSIDPQKAEIKKISHAILKEFVDYLRDKTNVTVLEGTRIEADDFVARWIQRHPEGSDTHVIISNDADFKQLVGPGIDLYDPIPNILYTSDGVYYKDDIYDTTHPSITRYGEIWKIKYSQPKVTLVYRSLEDESTKETFIYPMSPHPQALGTTVRDFTKHEYSIKAIKIVGEQTGWEYLTDTHWMAFPTLTEKTPLILYPHDKIRFIQTREIFDPKWELFLKCIRGDIRDNIKPSFLRVPETRLRKAYMDNVEYVKLINDSFMKDGEEISVRPLFEMNKMLIDLTAQPDDIIISMDMVIDDMTAQPPREMVELYFNNFVDLYKNRRLRELKSSIIPIISKPYVRQI
jgi:5'-3' exonuclease, N-terminal resolvase-like domain